MERTSRIAFAWPRTAEVVGDLLTVHALRADGRGRWIAGPDDAPEVVVTPPAVLPPADGDPLAWVRGLPDELGVEFVVLLRAGSAALGLWRADTLVAHKTFRRYTVRGHGKAQRKHLETKGKSRYGSRLRLQQAARLLEEVNERIAAWQRDEGPFDVIHRACPVRLWADLHAADPPPPFDARDPRLRGIRVHVHEPDFAELERVRRALRVGHVETRAEAPR